MSQKSKSRNELRRVKDGEDASDWLGMGGVGSAMLAELGETCMPRKQIEHLWTARWLLHLFHAILMAALCLKHGGHPELFRFGLMSAEAHSINPSNIDIATLTGSDVL